MAKKLPPQEVAAAAVSPAVSFTRKAIWKWLPILYALICVTFYLRTYDSAQVKITLVQMGGLALITMWVCLLFSEGRNAVSKRDLVFLAPFLIYLCYVLVSFAHVPYKGLSLDDFIRYIFYMSVALIVINEFSEKAVNNLTKMLVIAAYIAVLYGTLQVIDTRFYPPGIDKGIDPFVWRAAFGPRVFSTYGNPNFFADFALLIFFVFAAQYLKTRSFLYIPALVLCPACIYFTETKGAWLGFGAAFVVFMVVYGVFFLREYYHRNKWKLNLAAAAVFIICFTAVIVFAIKRKNSVNFRTATWMSTWEMIEAHPLVGTGVGSFKAIYPAYRRPQIFHIEGKHNTETDHAENEYLEHWMDNGLIGFGIFLWLVIFTVVTGLRSLSSQTAGLAPGARAPPRAYDLLGYFMAFAATMLHNFFDVSQRFVSSGVFLGLLTGLVINLSRGMPLYELREPQAETEKPKGGAPWLLWGLKFLVWAGLAVLVYFLFKEFNELQGPLYPQMFTGEYIQWHVAWIVLPLVVIWLAWVFAKFSWLSDSKPALVAILLMLYPMHYLWGFFRADVYHNLAIYYSKNQNWDRAIFYYDRVNLFNPNYAMSYYFRGNVFKDRLNMDKQYRADWGDKNNVPRDDYERAMDNYSNLRALAPNYVQMHFQVGELYLKMANYYSQKGEKAKAGDYTDKALARFNLYHDIDPVYPYTYYHLAEIYGARGQLDKAEKEMLDNINAAYCGEGPEHKHESAEAYNNLGVILLRRGKTAEAKAAFKRALDMDPNSAAAKANHQILAGYNPVQVRVNPPPK